MKIITIVENILKYSREARNSDKELHIRFMRHFGIILDESQIALFKKMPSLETARRIRQKLQQEGQYPADKAVGFERRFKGYTMQQRNPKADKVESVTEPKAISWLNDEV